MVLSAFMEKALSPGGARCCSLYFDFNLIFSFIMKWKKNQKKRKIKPLFKGHAGLRGDDEVCYDKWLNILLSNISHLLVSFSMFNTQLMNLKTFLFLIYLSLFLAVGYKFLMHVWTFLHLDTILICLEQSQPILCLWGYWRTFIYKLFHITLRRW